MLPLTATISLTALLEVSATKTFPLPSTATPKGLEKLLLRMRMVGLVAGTLPLTATISFTSLLP